jgi:anti-anti-sigma regulatory factor
MHSAVFSGQKQAVLVVPPELRGNVAAAGSAAINTNVTIDLSKVTFLNSLPSNQYQHQLNSLTLHW